MGDNFIQTTESRHVACLMGYIQISECSTLSTFCSACCSYAGKEARHANIFEPRGNAAQPPKRKRPCQSQLGGLNRCQAGTAHSGWHFKLGSSSAHQLCIRGESHWFTAAIYHLHCKKTSFPNHTKCHKILSKPILEHNNTNKLIKKTQKSEMWTFWPWSVKWKHATCSDLHTGSVPAGLCLRTAVSHAKLWHSACVQERSGPGYRWLKEHLTSRPQPAFAWRNPPGNTGTWADCLQNHC